MIIIGLFVVMAVDRVLAGPWCVIWCQSGCAHWWGASCSLYSSVGCLFWLLCHGACGYAGAWEVHSNVSIYE